MLYDETVSKIEPVNKDLEVQARHKIDFKTKPLGSLGMMEEIALKMALIRNDLNPVIKNKSMFVFAGDHGIAMEGVSAYPPEVTPQMVLNFLHGGAGINVLCRYNHIDMKVVDMGVNFDFNNAEGLINKKVRKGTRNFLTQDAMTESELFQSLESGMEVFSEQYKALNTDIAGVGEMGIGNSTSASAIISAATGLDPSETTGRGTGIDDSRLNNKISLIRKALASRKPDKENGLDILKKIGGYEIAGITGAVLASASRKVPVVLDGLISTAGGLIACIIKPETAGYLFAGHKSVEPGHAKALEMMGLSPIIDLKMRLGEGTGAALCMNIIEASCRILCEMASFDEAGVSNKE